MPRTHEIQHSMNAGEWSPLLEGRCDLQKYASALKTQQNMIGMPYGGVRRRPGTVYVADVKTSAKSTRLIPFEFSTTQAYIIEVGDQYFRFYRNSGQIETSPGTPTEVATPYLEADLFELMFAQSADTLYIAHTNYAPRKLTRTSHTAWTLTAIDFHDGPYLDENTDAAKTLTPSGTTGSITVTATGHTPFLAGHVGSFWRIRHASPAGTGYVKVTAFTATDEVDADVVEELADTAATSLWREGAWSGVRGYPAAVTLFQGRSWWGGSSHQPDTIWSSQSGDYEDMDPGTVLADEAMTFELASGRVNAIMWLAAHRRLLIGTSGQEWQVGGAGTGEPITPANRNAVPETTHGSTRIPPLVVQNAVLMLQRSQRKIQELIFTWDEDSYKTRDVTLFAEHVSEGGITQMCYEQEPYSVVWAIRSDGYLIGMTYDRGQEILGWHKHVTDGSFESVATIPHPDGDQDQTWVVVNRTIGGSTVRYVEYLDNKGGQYDAVTVDSGLIYSGASTATLTGLDHLEGETVDILGNKLVYPQQTVVSGQVTGLDPEVTAAEVGLPFESEIETMRAEVVGPTGSSQGRNKRWNRITIRIHESLGFKINDDQADFRMASDEADEQVELFTGDKQRTNLGWDTEARIKVEQVQPLPLVVLALMGSLEVHE